MGRKIHPEKLRSILIDIQSNRQLNNITRKNRNAPPSTKVTIARVAKIRITSLVEVVAAFNTVQAKAGGKEKIASLSRYGLYEYNIMPFGLFNGAGAFQTFINETLQDPHGVPRRCAHLP